MAMTTLHCRFCKHTWYPRKPEPPKQCPRCQRVYAAPADSAIDTKLKAIEVWSAANPLPSWWAKPFWEFTDKEAVEYKKWEQSKPDSLAAREKALAEINSIIDRWNKEGK